MIDEQEAQELMTKWIALKNRVKKENNPELLREFNQHTRVCMEKFAYLITMRTGRYKAYANYDDLNQEGFEVLYCAMRNYNPKKGSFFWWAHKYVETRISRSANLHTTIRYPMHVAKAVPPHKETDMPEQTEDNSEYIPDLRLEGVQGSEAIHTVIKQLTPRRQRVLKLYFGFDVDKPYSISHICQELHFSRPYCIKMIKESLVELREGIKI